LVGVGDCRVAVPVAGSPRSLVVGGQGVRGRVVRRESTAVHRASKALCQGQCLGRWKVSVRAPAANRAGIAIS
jgi:hypothetical protein